MPLNEIAVVVDGDDPAIVYGPGWNLSITPAWSNWFGGSAMVGSGNLSLNYSFYGISVSIYGLLTPTSTPTAEIDNGTSQGGYLDLPFYRPWYTTSPVSDHQHALTLLITNASYTLVDYLVVTAGPTTPLDGKTIIADDFDIDLRYKGHWNPQFGQVFPPKEAIPSGQGRLAYRNTTHLSHNAGDSFVFEFTGSSISVFGILQSHLAGRMVARFSVDGSSTSSYTAEFNNSTLKSFDKINTQFYHADLKPGTHTLQVQIVEATGDQGFMLDYILYNASFPNLLSKPPVGSPPPHSSNKIPFGATIGAIVGAAVLAMVVIVLCWRRRQAQKAIQRQDRIDLTNHYDAISERPISTIAHGQFYRKSSMGHSETTFSASNSPDSEHPVVSFSGGGSTSYGETDINRIDPFTTIPPRTRAPHYRKKSEVLSSVDEHEDEHDPDHIYTSPSLSRPSSLTSRRSKSLNYDTLSETPHPPSARTRSHRSRVSESFTTYTPTPTLHQAEFRRRTQEIYEMVARLEHDVAQATASGSVEGDARIVELRRRIDMLTRENVRLQARNALNLPMPTSASLDEPPPAYQTPPS